MARADGGFLARFPVPKNRLLKLDERSQFRIGVTRGLRPLYLFDRFATRRRRPPHRLSQAHRIPDLRACRRGKIGNRRRVAKLYDQPPCLWPAGDCVFVRRLLAGVAAHQASVRRQRARFCAPRLDRTAETVRSRKSTAEYSRSDRESKSAPTAGGVGKIVARSRKISSRRSRAGFPPYARRVAARDARKRPSSRRLRLAYVCPVCCRSWRRHWAGRASCRGRLPAGR